MRNLGAGEIIIPEYEGGQITGRTTSKVYPDAHPNLI